MQFTQLITIKRLQLQTMEQPIDRDLKERHYVRTL